MLDMARLYRLMFITGRFGGGKTSLAIAIAQWLIGRNYARYVASNIPLNFGSLVRTVSLNELREVDSNGPIQRDTVILLDEAWQHLSPRKSHLVEDWLAFMRKGNNFLLLPSVLKLANEVCICRCERIFNGPPLGVPLWLYKWTVGESRYKPDVKGHFWWWNPQRVFNLYDHKGIPREEYYIYDCWGESEE